MMIDDTGGTAFMIDWDERVLSFVRIDAQERREVLMQTRFEMAELPGLAVWLAERQHLWLRWRRLAERRGARALTRRLARLLEREPGEPSVGSLLTVQYRHEPEVVLAARMANREVEILRHRFETLSHRDAFLAWLDEGNELEKSQALSLVGLLQGRARLAVALDVLATTYLANPVRPASRTH